MLCYKILEKLSQPFKGLCQSFKEASVWGVKNLFLPETFHEFAQRL
jgi:hypothetical protein